MAKFYKSRFNDFWLKDYVFKDWVENIPDDDNKFYCQWCKFTGCSSATIKKALVKHLSTKSIKWLIHKKGGNLNIQNYFNLPKNNQIMLPYCASSSANKNNLFDTTNTTAVEIR